MEYAYDDWCIARMAKLLGKQDDAKLFCPAGTELSQRVRLVDRLHARKKADGTWRSPFDRRELVWDDFTEATSWNYTWFVPHDVPGLIGLMGGDQARSPSSTRCSARTRRSWPPCPT